MTTDEQQEKKEQYNKEHSEQYREQLIFKSIIELTRRGTTRRMSEMARNGSHGLLEDISIAVGVLVGNYMYTHYQEDKAPRLAFENGHIPSLDIPSTVPFIPMDMEISDLSKVIEATAVCGRYLVIYGEHGCGKTTLITQICNSDTIRKFLL